MFLEGKKITLLLYSTGMLFLWNISNQISEKSNNYLDSMEQIK